MQPADVTDQDLIVCYSVLLAVSCSLLLILVICFNKLIHFNTVGYDHHPAVFHLIAVGYMDSFPQPTTPVEFFS